MTDQHPNLLFGAYVLGSLSAAERRDVDLHLRDCPACAAELAELEPLRDLLASVDAADVEALDVEPSPDLFERITASVDASETPATPPHVVSVGSPRSSSRRRRSRPRMLVAAAVAAIALAGAGVGIGTLASSGSSPASSFSVEAGSVRMDAQLEPAKTGTTLHVTVAGLPINEHCTLIAVGKDGSRHPAGQWVASYGGKAQITTATDFNRDQLRQLVLLGTQGQTLVTLPVTGK